MQASPLDGTPQNVAKFVLGNRSWTPPIPQQRFREPRLLPSFRGSVFNKDRSRRRAVATIHFDDIARLVLSKNHAPPIPRMPAVTPAANHRYRCHDGGCYDNRGRRCNYNWPVRTTFSVAIAVKSGTATIRSTGAVHADE